MFIPVKPWGHWLQVNGLNDDSGLRADEAVANITASHLGITKRQRFISELLCKSVWADEEILFINFNRKLDVQDFVVAVFISLIRLTQLNAFRRKAVLLKEGFNLHGGWFKD